MGWGGASHRRKAGSPLALRQFWGQSSSQTPCDIFTRSSVKQRPTLTDEGQHTSGVALKVKRDVQRFLSEACPWASALPERLRRELAWEETSTSWFPTDQDVILILYAGLEDDFSFKAHMLSWPCQIIDINNKRPGYHVDHDMLRKEPYSSICQAAIAGRLKAVVAGPNCRATMVPKTRSSSPSSRATW